MANSALLRPHGRLLASTLAFLLCASSYGRTPTHALFEPNVGQLHNDVRFIWRGADGVGLLTDHGLELRKPITTGANGLEGSMATLRMVLSGPGSADWIGEVELDSKSNYFIGKQPSWKTNVPNFKRVRQRGLYPGVDAVWYGTPQGDLELDFVVHPYASTNQISIAFPGANLALSDHGDVRVAAHGIEMVLRRPMAYQIVDGVQKRVRVDFERDEADILRLQVGKYDQKNALTIDPTLVYSTYLGGVGTELTTGLTVDEFGNAYVGGNTSSLDLPLRTPVQSDFAGGLLDLFVAKLDPSGALIYSTYLGGTGNETGVFLSVAADGSLLIGGCTESVDFPTLNALQANRLGQQDAILVKLSPSGSSLEFSTYFGGAVTATPNIQAASCIRGLAFDRSDSSVVVSGVTSAIDFPTLNALQAAHGGGFFDAFIARFSADGHVVSSTFLGGSDFEQGAGVAVDTNGEIVAVGQTRSRDFPTTAGAIQPQFPGGFVAGYVLKLDSSAESIIFSTYLGGTQFIDPAVSGQGSDEVEGVGITDLGEVWVTGVTRSRDFPVTAKAFQKRHGASRLSFVDSASTLDGFAAKLSGTGSLLYSTYLGGQHLDQPTRLTVTKSGDAAIVGSTESRNFPLKKALDKKPSGIDAFVTIMSDKGLAFSTFLGGTGQDEGIGIGVDGEGDVIVAGRTSSVDFPMKDALQSANGGDFDAFVTAITLEKQGN